MMIAASPIRPPSRYIRADVSALAEAACAAEGVTLYWLLIHRRVRGRAGEHIVPASMVFQRVVARMREAHDPPISFPTIAAVLGRTNHSSVITAYRREVAARSSKP